MNDYKPPWETKPYQIAWKLFVIAMIAGAVMSCLVLAAGLD